jgi:effector-binding domain-containing protein
MAQNSNKPPLTLGRKILYILLGVLALLFIAALLLPRNIKTSVEAEINAPKRYVYNLINNHHNVQKWNAWLKDSKDVELIFDRTMSGNGSGYSWKSKEMGDGTIIHRKVTENSSIDEAALVMGGDTSIYKISLTEVGNKTKIKWDFEANLSFPMNIIGPIQKYFVNKYNKKGIYNMEAEIAKRLKGEYSGYQVKEISQNPRHFVTSRNVVGFDLMGQYYQQNIAAIYKKLQDAGLSAIGSPCALYYSYDEANKKSDMAAAVPVLAPSAVQELTSQSLSNGNAVVIDYYGDSAKNIDAHLAIDDYIKDKGYTMSYPVIEEFITDPLKEKDQSKWLTKIYYYVAEVKK